MRAVAHDVAAVLASTRLDRHVRVACGHRVALGEELEVMDDGLHRSLELLARWRQHLAVVDVDRSVGKLVQRLPQDLDRLAHLFDAHQVAAVAVAVVRDCDLEVVVLVPGVRNGLAQVPGHARTAEHRPGGPEHLRVLGREPPDADRA